MLFFQVKSPTEARRLLSRPGRRLPSETAPLSAALGRVTASAVCSPIDLPEFDRSVVDGFAVRAADTFGASAGLPALLRVVGEVPMGQGADLSLGIGDCARVATGGMLPAGADAMVMVEYTDAVDATQIEATRPCAPGENVVRRGDDVARGAHLVPAGRRLRPQDLGALAGVGITEVSVYRRPRVAILPTGDEIVPPETVPGPGEVRDINSISLAGAVEEAGGVPLPFPIVRDEPERLREAVARALADADLTLVAGGSSVGARDWTLEVLLQFPGAELLLHGVAIRPGKPVIAVAIPTGHDEDATGSGPSALVIGLPGNPVSALIVFQQFIRPVLKRLAGEEATTGDPMPAQSSISAVMATSYASDAGKEDYVRVRLHRKEGQVTATPLLGKSALITPLVQADGLVVIPEGVEGIEAGEPVTVELF